MSLYANAINEILPFIPIEIHGKTVEVFSRIPGTLLKFFDPKTITKKAECGEHKFANQKSRGYDDDLNSRMSSKDTSDSMSKKSHIQEGTLRSLSLRSKTSTKCYTDKESSCTGDLWFTGHGLEHNNDWNNLRSHLRESIKKIFRERHITEVSSSKLAREISTKCLEQCPNWGKHNQNSSAIVRFNNTYITDEPVIKMNMHVYVYAHLICECETSFMFRSQYKMSYDLTIELNGITIDPIKLSQFCRLISENSVSDSIKALEGNTILTWDDLNVTHSSRSNEKKLALTWDDL